MDIADLVVYLVIRPYLLRSQAALSAIDLSLCASLLRRFFHYR
jgi:hypothetical protein